MINGILACSTRGEPEPAVGMGATVLMWSDRNPGTIAEVLVTDSARFVRVTRDNHVFDKRTGEMTFTTVEGAVGQWYRRKTQEAKWRPVARTEGGRWKLQGDTHHLRIGERDYYRDPHQ